MPLQEVRSFRNCEKLKIIIELAISSMILSTLILSEILKHIVLKNFVSKDAVVNEHTSIQFLRKNHSV